jgi:hypothetical protein
LGADQTAFAGGERLRSRCGDTQRAVVEALLYLLRTASPWRDDALAGSEPDLLGSFLLPET